MTTTEPNVSLTGRYSIIETCELLGIHRNTLTRYTNKGRIRCGIRRVNGRKFYTGMEILKLWKAEM
ncbi:MAG: helix-turn-helix domain-containing protein [Sodaliphilus sp.]|nr:helix-turn-helix domain-containing protein [Sodaliphilus sp.]